MKKTSPSASRSQTVDRHGKEVTLTNYTQSSEDNYGENYSETTGSPYTITARAWSTNTSQTDRDNREAGEEEAERKFIVKDNASGIAELNDGGGRGASEIVEDGNTFYVLNILENSDGTLTLEAVLD